MQIVVVPAEVSCLSRSQAPQAVLQISPISVLNTLTGCLQLEEGTDSTADP